MLFKFERTMQRNIWIFLIFLIFTSLSCFKKNEKKNPSADKEAMMAAENAFSGLSEKMGMKKALMEYIDSNGVLLRPDTYPMVAGDAINYISQVNDSAYTMTWRPKGGSVAASGELGYTFGVYTLRSKSIDTLLQGSYVNIWKKQPDGKWKLLLDSGNQGISENE